MTSEVAILNKTAVALAADSKITVGPEGQQKTYDTVNKLFALSKYHPVAVMIYGNAEFMKYPWETIIKLYRQSLGITSFGTVREYAGHFLASLLQDYRFSNADIEENVRNVLISYMAAIESNARHRVLARETAQNTRQIKKIFSDVIREHNEYVSSLPNLDYDPDLSEDAVYIQYKEQITSAIDSTIGGMVSSHSRKHLIDFNKKVFLKDDFSRISSGIVFAGFGDAEKFPTLIAFDLDGVVGKNIKRKESNYVDVSREMTGAIVPFAQKDMVARFMEGIDPAHFQFLYGAVTTLFAENTLSVVDKYVAAPPAEIQKIKRDVMKTVLKNLQEFVEHVSNHRRQMYVDKIIDTVIVLPKEELANMAEALVSVTALSRRVSMDVESVGGPIDVAVVSKGDGLIWVKRKHYFDAKQNPQFFANYYRMYNRSAREARHEEE